MSQRAAVIMAAGQGTRMKSPTPKVLHRIGGRTMLDRAIDAVQAAGCERVVVVCGTHSPAVAEHVCKRLGEAAVAIQDPPLGTAHAVLSAKDALAGFTGDVIVTNADCPLLTAGDFAPLFERRAAGDDLVMLAFEAADPALYGRMIQDADGALLRIVEARDASPEEKAVRACYSGILCAPAGPLFDWLAAVDNNNVKAEYYITSIVGIANAAGKRVGVAFTSETAVMGADDQAGVARAEVLALLGPAQVRETLLTTPDLHHANELFVTNALMGIMPVCRLDDRVLDVTHAPVTQSLQASYRLRETASLT
jgi:bifunctional UDP-N-acetylglucosamine pyrophosphorylase/glucosamine-1-phosphate N-acetyltransferase